MIGQKDITTTIVVSLIVTIIGFICYLFISSTFPLGGLLGIINPKPTSQAATFPTETITVNKITTLVAGNGGRVDWGQTNNLIAFGKYGLPAEKYNSEIYTMNPDGSNQVCLTCASSTVPHTNNDQPAWSPNTKYLIFQSVDPNLTTPPGWTQQDIYHNTQAGFGFNNNIWAYEVSSQKFYNLTQISSGESTLHPHFSHSGGKLTFGYRHGVSGTAQWVIRVADFVVDSSGPHLANIQDYQPLGGAVSYETHDFTLDDQNVIYSTSGDPSVPLNNCSECMMSVHQMNLASGQDTQLTQTTGVWNEHAHLSPDGKVIDWISSQGYSFDPANWESTLSTDLWLMNTDGSSPQQLTFYNTPGHPESTRDQVIIADNTWSPDGNNILATMSDASLQGVSNNIILINLTVTKASPSPQPSPSTSCPLGPSGDINCNGTVDLIDYSIVVHNYGKTGANIPGDVVGPSGSPPPDGTVNLFDYSLVVHNFGKHT